ncbi:MAG: PTS IIA-like nitrogen-regulatory protein PtsN [Alphaproteobacteria bacterium]|nr:PTS IIA-like nitrogen-regulatory protein PtsN [Alphaproteobacteria bacterium]NDC56351.1 PTS IIA-like nitrogen-regulatory protein PtsN [Alphaproteobacteria bacterium]NDG04690.1 PTS IIA-like nitrogen-regulatory protein PtsN [Alphaproteobacteria bacterium]
MTLTEMLASSAIMLDVAADQKKNLLHIMATHAAELYQLTDHDVFDVLWEREKLGTTGVGHGIAIPHGKLDGVGRVRGLFARLKTPIDYEAIDEQPVDLVFALLAPRDAGADHLKALATISGLLRDQQVCQKLRAAKTVESVMEILGALNG